MKHFVLIQLNDYEPANKFTGIYYYMTRLLLDNGIYKIEV